MKLLRRVSGYRRGAHPVHGASALSRRQRLRGVLEYGCYSSPLYKSVYAQFLSTESDLTDEEFYYGFRHLPIVVKQDLKAQRVNNSVENTDFARSFIHSFYLNGWRRGARGVVFVPSGSYLERLFTQSARVFEMDGFNFKVMTFQNITHKTVEKLLATLRRRKAVFLMISPSSLHHIAEIMHHENMDPFEMLEHINVCGEFFPECSKRFIQMMFPESDIQSIYNSSTFGNIAHQRNFYGSDYNVFENCAYLEQGSHNSILLTHYTKNSLPIIRYQTGDVGRVVTHRDGSQSIMCLEGRSSDYVVGADGYLYYASFFNNFVNEINRDFKNSVVHFSVYHGAEEDRTSLRFDLVLADRGRQGKIEMGVRDTLGVIFSNYDHIDVVFSDQMTHDCSRGFKIINNDSCRAGAQTMPDQRQVS